MLHSSHTYSHTLVIDIGHATVDAVFMVIYGGEQARAEAVLAYSNRDCAGTAMTSAVYNWLRSRAPSIKFSVVDAQLLKEHASNKFRGWGTSLRTCTVQALAALSSETKRAIMTQQASVNLQLTADDMDAISMGPLSRLHAASGFIKARVAEKGGEDYSVVLVGGGVHGHGVERGLDAEYKQ